MFKYFIAICIISLCDSAPSIVGTYDQLILAQHWPKTAFFAPLGHASINSIHILEYLSEHWILFNAQRWVIHGLWPIDSSSQNLTECENYYGMKPTYNHAHFNQDFIQELKLRWPTLSVTGTEESLWETEFNKHGSCVSINDLFYFKEAVRLLESYNIEGILSGHGILPGNRYTFDHIVDSITNTLKKQVYLKCIPAQKTEEQYLLEVQLCFNSLHKLVSCSPSGKNHCDINKIVIYS